MAPSVEAIRKEVEAQSKFVSRLRDQMARVIVGQQYMVDRLLVGLLANGHVLIEGVPGLAKTTAVKTLAQAMNCSFSRLQFTPDLLPTDITGSMIYRSDIREFEFVPGPVFANVLLADEINRAPPRTQSALLEAMSEGQVSVDGTTHSLPEPFIVVATQNPFEFEGTYSLPESQMDRFLIRTSVGYPQREMERDVMRTHRLGEPVDGLQPVVSLDQVRAAQAAAREIRFDDLLVEYLLDIVEETRNNEYFRVGVSTRGALSFYRGCQARAITEGRDHVIPDDVKQLAVPALAHRVVSEGLFQGIDRTSVEQRMEDLVNHVKVPM